MGRPKCDKKIDFCPKVKRFKPHGIPCFETVELTAEESEALRLKNILGLSQTQAAERMEISQSTFQRLLSSAYKKVSTALINGITIVWEENKLSETLNEN